MNDQHETSRAEPCGRLRCARMDDVPTIQQIVNSFADRGDMLPRSLAELYENLRDFVVWERAGSVVACCALHVTWTDLAEIKSLGVIEPAQGKGIGSALVRRCVEDARVLNARRVFALTYRPEFFERFGFEQIDKAQLPHKVWAECTRCVKFPDCDEQAVQIDLRERTRPVTNGAAPESRQI